MSYKHWSHIGTMVASCAAALDLDRRSETEKPAQTIEGHWWSKWKYFTFKIGWFVVTDFRRLKVRKYLHATLKEEKLRQRIMQEAHCDRYVPLLSKLTFQVVFIIYTSVLLFMTVSLWVSAGRTTTVHVKWFAVWHRLHLNSMHIH